MKRLALVTLSSILLAVLLSACGTLEDSTGKKEDTKVTETTSKKESNPPRAKEDTEKKQDKKVKSTKSKKKKGPEFTKEDEQGLKQAFNRLIDESNGTIHKIEFQQDGRYDLIDAYIDDKFDVLPKNEKVDFAKNFGGKIKGNVQSRIYHGSKKDRIYVYFKTSDGRIVAQEKMFDENEWKAK